MDTKTEIKVLENEVRVAEVNNHPMTVKALKLAIEAFHFLELLNLDQYLYVDDPATLLNDYNYIGLADRLKRGKEILALGKLVLDKGKELLAEANSPP